MYGRTHRIAGLTLVETTLVVATIALLIGLAVPAVRSMINSFESEGGTRSVIQAALNSARTMAMTRQRYVGVRFQRACTSDDPANPLKGELSAPQYMVFIMQDEPKNMGGLTCGFRVLEGLEPIRLPDTIGVMSEDRMNPIVRVGSKREGSLGDITTFSIVFAPSGKLVVTAVRVRNRDGVDMPANDPGSTQVSYDDVFNSVVNICRYRQGMFIQDDYATTKNFTSIFAPGYIELGLGEEESVTSFFFYDVATLRTLYNKVNRPDPEVINFLGAQKRDRSVYVSAYTGGLMSSS